MYSCVVLCSGLVLCSSIDVVIYLVFTFQQKANNSRGGCKNHKYCCSALFFFHLRFGIYIKSYHQDHTMCCAAFVIHSQIKVNILLNNVCVCSKAELYNLSISLQSLFQSATFKEVKTTSTRVWITLDFIKLAH